MVTNTRWTKSFLVLLGANAAACGGSTAGPGGSGAAAATACVGTPTPCGSLSTAQCTTAAGCATGACSGTAATCAGFATSTECLLQQGCTPNGTGGACSGIAAACLAFSTDSECRGQQGCTWQDGCSGRAAACEALTEGACLAQPGCRLGVASTSDAGADAAIDAAPARVCTDDAVPANLLIDDMEDRTSTLSSSTTYGGWYVFDDMTTAGRMTPAPGTMFEMEAIPGGRCASEYAMRMSGTGFTVWGAGMGFDFGYVNLPGGAFGKMTVDASGFAGVRFWARVGEATGAQLNYSILAGACPPSDGGDGDGAPDAAPKLPSDCAQSFAKGLRLTSDWVRYDIPFEQLLGPTRNAIPRDQIFSFEFVVPANATFDLWIDDISWIPVKSP